VQHWLAEIRRRNVHRALIAYLAAGWLLAQVADLLAQAFAWPGWVLRSLVVALALGLPAVVVVAWFFRLTLAGLVRERDEQGGSQPETVQPPDGKRTSLAVLPFKPLVASSRDEALELGMTDTLIARLSGVADVIVSPLSSVRRFAGLEQDPMGAGRELRVGSVLEGTVQKSGDRLRVTARLLDVGDGRQLWSGRFDEAYSDIFGVQDSIAQRVSSALALHLSTEDRVRMTQRATRDTMAYDLFLNGRYYWNRRAGPEDLGRASEFYAKAVERDPRFALAHAGLADVLALQAVFGARPPGDMYPRALDASERALAVDPGLPAAHATRGHIRLHFMLDWRGSLDEYDMAIRLDPRNSVAHMWRGFRLLFEGADEEGLAELEVARALEPDSLALAINHARGLYWLRRYHESESELERVLAVEPTNGLARCLLASLLTAQGRCDDALNELAGGRYRAPGSHALLGVALAAAGRGEEARAEFERLAQVAGREYVPAYDLAAVAAARGDAGGAFEWLERALVERSPLLTTLRVDPVIDVLRGDSRYAAVEARMGMPAARAASRVS
jgi:TolB-like protein/Flp pilus assembly protein TadD